jgi:VanZ family protein
MKRWAILCGLAIVAIIVLADTRNLSLFKIVNEIPFGDKVGHFVLFGLLSLTVNMAVLEARPAADKRSQAVTTSLLLAVPIALEELSQRWIPGRTFSLLDLTASLLGVACFAWLAITLRGHVEDRSVHTPQTNRS